MKFIFIGGASASGKTTLAEKLQAYLLYHGMDIQLISMDDYSVEAPPDITDIQAYRRETNFDRVEMYDLELLKVHVLMLNQGLSIEKPLFEFSTNRRGGTQTVRPNELIIIEGLFALYFAKLLKELELDMLTVFVGKSSYREIINCRLQRDVETRHFFASDVIRKERRNVGPAYFEIIAKSKNGVDFDISNDEHSSALHHPLDKAVEDIFDNLIHHKSVVFSNSSP